MANRRRVNHTVRIARAKQKVKAANTFIVALLASIYSLNLKPDIHRLARYTGLGYNEIEHRLRQFRKQAQSTAATHKLVDAITDVKAAGDDPLAMLKSYCAEYDCNKADSNALEFGDIEAQSNSGDPSGFRGSDEELEDKSPSGYPQWDEPPSPSQDVELGRILFSEDLPDVLLQGYGDWVFSTITPLVDAKAHC